MRSTATDLKKEIERKFWVKNMPDLSGISPVSSVRYFLAIGNESEIRITKIGRERFIYEKKSGYYPDIKKEAKTINEAKFVKLKPKAAEPIMRDRYDLSVHPEISIMIYKGKFAGLIRVEVEFESEEDAKSYIPAGWMGEEITNLPIARDSQLVKLSREELNKYLKSGAESA